MKKFTITVSHSELTTLVIENLRMHELSKDQRYADRARYLQDLTGLRSPEALAQQVQSPPVDPSQTGS